MADFPPPDPQAVRAVKDHRKQLMAMDEQQMALMADEWLRIERNLQLEISALAREITMKIEAGELAISEILRLRRYQNLAAQAALEAEKYADWALELVTNQQSILAAQALDDTVEAIQLSYEGFGIDYPTFDLLPVDAVQSLIGAASNGSPLNTLFANISDEAVMGMTNALIDGVSLGLPPAEVARRMADGYGLGLNRALNIARTEQLNAYRRASQAQYIESGVTIGYRRIAQHTATTCMGCIAQDGRFYRNEQDFEEHPRGRCGPIPVVIGAPYPEFETGEEWFLRQPESIQLSMMGPGRFEAFQRGVAFDEFATRRVSDEWGGSWVPRNVSDLPGN